MQAEGGLPTVTKSYAAKRLEKQMNKHQDTVWFEEPGSQNHHKLPQNQPAEGSVWLDQPQEVGIFKRTIYQNFLSFFRTICFLYFFVRLPEDRGGSMCG